MGRLRLIARAKVGISVEIVLFLEGVGSSQPSASSLSGGHGMGKLLSSWGKK